MNEKLTLVPEKGKEKKLTLVIKKIQNKIAIG